MAVNTITKMGAVNWRTMALAAVVILLAMEKRMLVPHTAKAPSRTQRFILGLWRMAHRYSPMTTRATAVLAPLMDIPFHGITLMQSPPMLYSTAAAKTHRTPLCFADTTPPPFLSLSTFPDRPNSFCGVSPLFPPLRRGNTQRGSGSLKNAPCPEGQRA